MIAAILLERNLQNVANYLILSLAVADLLVACLVMPLGAVYEVSKQWTLGPELCDMWTSSDVLCCTASILHLVAIALDRSVVDPIKRQLRFKFIMIHGNAILGALGGKIDPVIADKKGILLRVGLDTAYTCFG